MKKIVEFEFDADSGVTTCFITRGTKVYYGTAVCHPEDRDMLSEYTGTEIAHTRARIDMLQDIRDNEIIPSLKALEHLESCIVTSQNYDRKAYESRMLRRQIHKLKDDLATIRNTIADERKFLKDYVAAKEKIYNRLRAKKIEDKTD